MAGRVVLVDDHNEEIKYLPEGSWGTDSRIPKEWEEYGPPLGGSMHTTVSSGSFSYLFAGTSVMVYGPNTKISGLTWACAVDNIPLYVGGSGDALAACWQDVLEAGHHTLTVNVTITATNRTFYFDRIHYTPLPSANLENQMVLVQQRDPAIDYSSGWGSPDIMSTTNTNGARVTISFIGVSLTWYSGIQVDQRKALATATYTIDGGAPEQINFGGNPTEQLSYNQAIFHTPTLPMGNHEMTVVYNGDDAKAPLSLDYLIIQNGSLPLASSTTSTSSTATTSSSPAVSGRGKSSFKIWMIGPVVGVIGVLLIVLFRRPIIKFIRHRKRPERGQQTLSVGDYQMVSTHAEDGR